MQNNTILLNQEQLVKLYNSSKSNISKYIFKERKFSCSEFPNNENESIRK